MYTKFYKICIQKLPIKFLTFDIRSNEKVKKKKVNSMIQVCQIICAAVRELVPCAQFKNREKQPWRSVNFS